MFVGSGGRKLASLKKSVCVCVIERESAQALGGLEIVLKRDLYS